MIRRWTLSFTTLYHKPTVRVVLLTLYYLVILLALIVMYGRGDFKTPPFIYQLF